MANYTNYSVKKLTNNEFRELEVKFKLNVNKFVGDSSKLYFDIMKNESLADGKQRMATPFLMNTNTFFTIIAQLIQTGLVEALSYDPTTGVLNMTYRDGNTIKRYEYDFNINNFTNSMNDKTKNELLAQIYEIVSIYQFSPISSVSSEQRYLRMIYDIMDRDRNVVVEDPDELRRIFEVYNAHRKDILEKLLGNVVFSDNNGNIINYKGLLRIKKLEAIRYDILQQMELAMLLFAVKNNAEKQYREYLDNTCIEEIKISYKFMDKDGNIIDAPPEVEGGTIFSLARDAIYRKLLKIKELSEKLGKPIHNKIDLKGKGRILKKKDE